MRIDSNNNGLDGASKGLRDALREGPEPDRSATAAAGAAAQRLVERICSEGLAEITYGPVESPFGTLHAALTRRGLVRLSFPEEEEPQMLEKLARRLSPSIVRSASSLDPVRR